MKYFGVELYAIGPEEWVPIKSFELGIGAIEFDSSERLSLDEATERLMELSQEKPRFEYRISEYES